MKANSEVDNRFKLKHRDLETIIRLKTEGWTQGALAQRFGVTQSHVSRIVSDYLKTNDKEEQDNA